MFVHETGRLHDGQPEHTLTPGPICDTLAAALADIVPVRFLLDNDPGKC